ncbi:VWA domain-containing protein [Ruminococcus sp.]|uniref:VWA domain-containing protein n=1 Tax=Ruminococcus sp. TaxID=41978 RepID=UPI003FD7C2C1
MTNESKAISVNRWRLVLGGMSDKSLEFSGDPDEIAMFQDMEDLLDYLYSRGQGDDVRDEGRSGGQGGSVINAAEWITKVRDLFPKQTAEVLECQALDKFNMTELLTDKKVLEEMKPDIQLLKTIIQLKHLMSGEVLQAALKIARQVAEKIRQKLESTIKRSLIGRLDRNTSSALKCSANLDFKKTIRRNLKNFDKASGQLILKDVYFSSRVKKHNKKRIIIAIDESGSMLGSVIYSAVMAQIISELPFADVRLIIFDTNIVDLSDHADDPAQTIMSVQLGGGTNIGKALAYCESLITTPCDTCVIVVTDLYEGGSVSQLMNVSKNIITSGAHLSFLTALDENADPAFDKTLGQLLADIGAFVGSLTPDKLGDYIGRIFS